MPQRTATFWSNVEQGENCRPSGVCGGKWGKGILVGIMPLPLMYCHSLHSEILHSVLDHINDKVHGQSPAKYKETRKLTKGQFEILKIRMKFT